MIRLLFLACLSIRLFFTPSFFHVSCCIIYEFMIYAVL